MKRCPECRRDYHDETLLYCLEDGTALVQGSVPSPDEPQTAILQDTSPPAEADTRAQIHTTNRPVAVPQDGLPTSGPRQSSTLKLATILAAVLIVTTGGYLGYRKFFSATPQINSIAVMPFVNASGDPDAEYLSDGVTESLINNLSQLGGLSVKGRSSVFRYKGKDTEPQQIAADLKVQAVLNGRVIQRGDNITISLDLVDGTTGDQIWGDQYTRKAGDIAALQSEIARNVSQKLRAKLTGAEETAVLKNQTQNSEAYQLYLQGRFQWNKRTDAGNQKAIDYFKQAIEKDPNYAMAYVGLAESYILTSDRTDDRFAKMKAAALRALEIDPSLGEPHAALGAYKANYEHDTAAGEQEYRRAIELSPNYATAYHWFGENLSQLGRFDDALPIWRKAVETDPFSLAIGTDYALEYLFYSRKYDEAADYLKKLIETDPNYVRAHYYLSEVYMGMGRYEDSISEREKAALLDGANPDQISRSKGEVLTAFKAGGPKGYWSKVLELQQNNIQKGIKIGSVVLAETYLHLGKKDEAFELLGRAVEEQNSALDWLKVDPRWDAIRTDPRFGELLRRMKLPE